MHLVCLCVSRNTFACLPNTVFPLCDLSAHEGHSFFPNLAMLAEIKCTLFIYFNGNLKTLSLFLLRLKVLRPYQVLHGRLLPVFLETGFPHQLPAALWVSDRVSSRRLSCQVQPSAGTPSHRSRLLGSTCCLSTLTSFPCIPSSTSLLLTLVPFLRERAFRLQSG